MLGHQTKIHKSRNSFFTMETTFGGHSEKVCSTAYHRRFGKILTAPPSRKHGDLFLKTTWEARFIDTENRNLCCAIVKLPGSLYEPCLLFPAVAASTDIPPAGRAGQPLQDQGERCRQRCRRGARLLRRQGRRDVARLRTPRGGNAQPGEKRAYPGAVP